jgi:septum formation protein
MMELILASGSRYRREQLARLDVPFSVDPADIDERAVEAPSLGELALELARRKARVVAGRHPDAWVLGGDQIIALDGEELHKPGTVERACAQLARLQGRTHELLCAVALVGPGGQERAELVRVEMEMRPLTEAEIARYVARDSPLDCAGSYMLEQGGVQLFDAMRGDDYTAIVGLPLTRVRAMLEWAGLFGRVGA